MPELYDPANAFGRNNIYPNAVHSALGAEPSIRGRQLRVPIPIFWALNSQQAFPLVCLQYNELQVEVTLRPIRELFQIRDVTQPGAPVVAPNFNIAEHKPYRFLNPPPNVDLTYNGTELSNWNENIHLSCTYAFLEDEEARQFAMNQQHYLFKELHDSWFYKVNITDRVWLQNSTGLVTSWVMRFQRSDVSSRNEWSNFTNWAFDYLPSNVAALAPTMVNSPCPNEYTFEFGTIEAGTLGYGLHPGGQLTQLHETGPPAPENALEIMVRLGITLDGAVREEDRGPEFFLYEQQYLRSSGIPTPGLYCYNFCLDTSPFNLQPSGAMNLSKYSKVELSFTTITPPLNPEAAIETLCDPETGGVIATNKSMASLYEYVYNFLVIEERYNVLVFMGGNAALMSAK
jgi:hypothetical protein